jgi:hypothetical protein
MCSAVVIQDNAVRIVDLVLSNPDVVQYFRQTEEPERERTAVRALELGVFCLQRAQLGSSLDFVRGEVDKLIGSVRGAISAAPDDLREKLSGESGPLKMIEAKLVEVRQLFTDNLDPNSQRTTLGQALARLRDLLDPNRDDSVQKRLDAAIGSIPQELRSRLTGDSGPLTMIGSKLDEVKQLFTDNLDPNSQRATLGQALARLRDLLDPSRDDSVQKRVDTAISSIAEVDGKLAEAVKKAAQDGTKTLRERVDALINKLEREEGAAEALAETPEKGYEFEEELKPMIQNWASVAGAEPEHVGPNNLPGDFVLTLRDTSLGAAQLRMVLST